MSKKGKQKSDSLNNPFGVLKGLSVSGQQKAEARKQPPMEAPLLVPPPDPLDDAGQFEQAMELLGVRQVTQDDILEKSIPLTSAVDVKNEPDRHDEIDLVHSSGSRRHSRKLAQRIGAPEATLDLHGVAAVDVVNKVGRFIENAVFHEFLSVRILPGKGLHSPEGPVLRPLVEAYLSGPGRIFVSEWTRAPQQQGGAGALLVLLRQKSGLD